MFTVARWRRFFWSSSSEAHVESHCKNCGVGGVVTSRKRDSRVLREQRGSLGWGSQDFTTPAHNTKVTTHPTLLGSICTWLNTTLFVEIIIIKEEAASLTAVIFSTRHTSVLNAAFYTSPLIALKSLKNHVKMNTTARNSKLGYLQCIIELTNRKTGPQLTIQLISFGIQSDESRRGG